VRGTFNVDGFYNNFSDQQLELGFDPKPGAPVAPASGILNAGKSRIWGVEVESTLLLFPGFTFDVNYTYLNTKIKDVTVPSTPADSPYIVVAGVHAGDALTLSPRNKVTATGTYTLPFPDNIGRIDVGATFTHTNAMLSNYADRSSPFPQVADLSVLPATDLLNLNLEWKSIFMSRVDVSLFATNVANKQYYTFVPGLYSASLGFETANLGMPRMYGVRLRYSW